MLMYSCGFRKLVAVYEYIYDSRKDNIDKAFGILTSHSFVVNVNMNNYKDLEEVCHR